MAKQRDAALEERGRFSDKYLETPIVLPSHICRNDRLRRVAQM
jgi:hypothetical protein